MGIAAGGFVRKNRQVAGDERKRIESRRDKRQDHLNHLIGVGLLQEMRHVC